MTTHRRGCSVDGCPKPLCAKNLCRLHWERQHNTGTTDDPPPRAGDRNSTWKGDAATYGAVHLRMSNGPRPDSCETCGARGGRFEWALRAEVPREGLLVSPEGYYYSTDPSHYANLCKPCHNKLDLSTPQCRKGHDLSGGNLYIQPSNGKRYCRRCQADRRRQRTERDRLKSPLGRAA